MAMCNGKLQITTAVEVAEIKVDGPKIVFPIGTTFSISIMKEDQEQEVMMEQTSDGRISALFPKDDVDFTININNEASRCGLLFEMIINDESSWYSIEPRTAEKLQTIVTNEQKLEKMHFKFDDDDDDAEDEAPYSTKTDDVSRMRDGETSSNNCSSIRFNVQVETPTVQKPVAVVHPLSPHVCICGPHSTCIYIRSGTDETLPLMVDLDFTVEALQHLISDKYGVIVKRQRLSYGGVALAANSKLSDYRICEDSTLQLEEALLPLGKITNDHRDANAIENSNNKDKSKPTINTSKLFRSNHNYKIKPFTIVLRLAPTISETDCKTIQLAGSDIKVSDPFTTTVYLNDVLCYIQNSLPHEKNETIIQNCMVLFDSATLTDARQMIIRVCRNQILEAFLKLPRIRKGPNKKELCIKDILQVLNLLPTEIAPIFVASERTSMPPDQLVTGNVVAMANEIAHLKSEVARLHSGVERNHQETFPSITENQAETKTLDPKAESDDVSKEDINNITEEKPTWANIVAKRP